MNSGTPEYIGHTANKDISVAPELFTFISEFDICDFNAMFSDVHNIINFPLPCNEIETITRSSVDTILGKKKTH
jgi:hypothetical protein